jgi:hypothetical protein
MGHSGLDLANVVRDAGSAAFSHSLLHTAIAQLLQLLLSKSRTARSLLTNHPSKGHQGSLQTSG